VIAAVALAATVALPAVAFGWNEVTNVDVFEFVETEPVRTGCASCHQPYGGGSTDPWGVHGGYNTTTNKCVQCHTLHDSDFARLLPGPTIRDTCYCCHDGTGGEGVYGAIWGRLGVLPGADHSTETTTQIPGGDPSTGGASTGIFSGVDGTLTCSDCHATHGSDVVVAFKGDRQRTDWGLDNPVSTKLLRQKPRGATVAVAEYGSDWCLACHAGRSSTLATVHNHPVETTGTATPGNPYVYRNLPILAVSMPTSSTVLGGLGDSNRGYLMPYPRTTGAAAQDGHNPICQQCHEDTRSVGTLNANGTATAADFQVSPPVWMQPDGANATDNPRFTTFPHETINAYFLVETQDGLCLNCHVATQLP
jgi:predicted CXXCH cytochrome family protein